MSLNCQKIGYPLCEVKGGSYNKQKIYISDQFVDDNPKVKTFNKLQLDDPKSSFQLIPNTKKQRQAIMIVGQSGSGKTVWACNYIAEYVKTYPNNPIYVFSNVSSGDPSLAPVQKHLKYITISDNLLEDEPLTHKDFDNCLLYFDDIESINNKNKLRDLVESLLDDVLLCGRHNNISVIFIQHVPTNGCKSKVKLFEADFFVYFPHGAIRNTVYALESYFGVNKDQVKKIKTLRSRWCCVSRNYPQVAVTEKNVFLLSE